MTPHVVLDAYGTLLDIRAPVLRLAPEIGPETIHLADLWRDRQLELAWVASMTGQRRSFWSLTARALDQALAATGLRDGNGLRDALLDAWRAPDPFADAGPALGAMRGAGAHLWVLSNGGLAMLEPVLRGTGLMASLDGVLSAEAGGAFKPDPRSYAVAAERIGGDRAAIWFASSNWWDVAGAAAFGFRTIWIDREGAEHPMGPGQPHERLASLAELPALVGP